MIEANFKVSGVVYDKAGVLFRQSDRGFLLFILAGVLLTAAISIPFEDVAGDRDGRHFLV